MKESKEKWFKRLAPPLGERGMTRQSHRKQLSTLLAVALVTLAWGNLAQGEAPSGSLQYALGPQDGVPLWNFSGPYALPYGTVQLHQEANGKIVASYDALGAGSIGLSGAISGEGAYLKMRLQSAEGVPELVTDGEFDFWPDWVNREDKLSLAFDANTGAFTGTDRVIRTREEVAFGSPNSFWPSDKTYIRRTRSVSVLPVAMRVPESADGNWSLSLEIVPAGNRLSGTAAIAFSNGESFRFQFLGRYSPKTGRTTLLLKGDGTDKGASLSLSLSGTDLGIESMYGTVGGQRIQFSRP